MNSLIVRAGLLAVLCFVASYASGKGPCDDIANVEKKQVCQENEAQKAKQQTIQQQEAQRQAQLKAQQAVAQKKTQEDALRQQQAKQQAQLKAPQEAQRQAQLKAQQDQQAKLVAQAKKPPSAPAQGSVIGKLHKNSASGAALAGVSVTADGKSAATDSDGKFRLDGIASGSISIAFSKSGYEPFQTSVNIVAGQSQNVGDKWLTAKVLPTPATVPTPAAAKGSVVGKLHEKSASGVALSGAIVTAGGKSTSTDNIGSFRLDGISTGNTTVAISKSGYEPFQVSVNIVAGQSQNVGDKWLIAKVAPAPAPAPPPVAATGSVSGRLHKTSASGPVLAGVAVTSGGKSVTTDKDGKFKLEGIPVGNATIAFSITGYEAYQGSVSIVAGKTADLGDKWLVSKASPVPVPPPVAANGSVSGRLHKTSASGPVLAGVVVTSGGKSVTTDKDGKFKLEGIPVGNATIAFSITGYEAYQGSVSIVAGRTADLGERWLSEKTISISRSKPINAASGKNIFDSYGLVVEKQYHAGVDYPAPHGTPVFAVMSGKVKTVPMPAGSDNHCMGNIIFLPHENGRQYYLYAHLSKIMVKDGDSVKAGDAIGAVGDTGFNLAARERCRLKSSAHLHLELKDSPVLHNPKGTPQVWGYTPGHATDFGYADPTK